MSETKHQPTNIMSWDKPKADPLKSQFIQKPAADNVPDQGDFKNTLQGRASGSSAPQSSKA